MYSRPSSYKLKSQATEYHKVSNPKNMLINDDVRHMKIVLKATRHLKHVPLHHTSSKHEHKLYWLSHYLRSCNLTIASRY